MEEQVYAFLKSYPMPFLILSIIGSLCVIATLVAPFTPTKKDDDALEAAKKHPIGGKLLSFLMRFSVIPQKKAE
jgi:hypothetical protein